MLAELPFPRCLLFAVAITTADCASSVVPDDRSSADVVDLVDAACPDPASFFNEGPTTCPSGLVLIECSGPAWGGAACVTRCSTSADCHDSCRPYCVSAWDNPPYCSPFPDDHCTHTRCAAWDTPIATPAGWRRISDIRAGDRVYGVQDAALAVVEVVATSRTPVHGHSVVRVTLANGQMIRMSAGHPDFAGRPFGALRAGDDLSETPIVDATTVPYEADATYDILTNGERGAYVAGSVVVGSTLWQME